MDAALAANRIFIVDLEILSRLKLDKNKKVGKFKIGKMRMCQSRHPTFIPITDKYDTFKTFFVRFFRQVHSLGVIQIRNNDPKITLIMMG